MYHQIEVELSTDESRELGQFSPAQHWGSALEKNDAKKIIRLCRQQGFNPFRLTGPQKGILARAIGVPVPVALSDDSQQPDGDQTLHNVYIEADDLTPAQLEELARKRRKDLNLSY